MYKLTAAPIGLLREVLTTTASECVQTVFFDGATWQAQRLIRGRRSTLFIQHQ